MPRKSLRLAAVGVAAAVAISLSGCEAIFGDNLFPDDGAQSSSTPTPTATCSNFGFESVFSAYGSVHYTLELADELTLYLDMWTEQKTHEWFPETEKSLNFVINVLDSSVPLKADFERKRKVYMSELVVEANTVTKDGSQNVEQPFAEDLDPIEATLDPEALHSRYGLLITSPKGGFQREGNVISAVKDDTIGMNMDFTMTLSAQKKKGSKKYNTRVQTVQLPIAVFTKATQNASTSCATNATLAPELLP